METTKEISTTTLVSWMNNGVDTPFHLVDVREPDEHATGIIPGAYLLPLSQLPEVVVDGNLPEWFDHPQGPIVVQCRSGVRSLKAMDLLEAAGFSGMVNLVGGILDWTATEGAAPLVDPDPLAQ